MNQNLIRRTPAANRPKPFSIRLNPIPYNEKAAFVKSVCASLIDSRFGPGRSVTMLTHLTDWPEDEDVFYDLTPEGPVPSFSILPASEVARRHVEAFIRHQVEQYELERASIRGQNLLPPNLGRGSPQISGTHGKCAIGSLKNQYNVRHLKTAKGQF